MDIVTEVHLTKNKAPIQKDETIGELIIFKNGVEVNRVALQTTTTIEKANIFDWLKRIAYNWNMRNPSNK
jgi:hypothetical protein